MTKGVDRKIVLVTRRTRLEELVQKHHTLDQAKFYLEQLGADFADYRREHEAYLDGRRVTLEVLEAHGRYQVIDRGFLPNFLFGPSDVVIALGQDGLVANTLKYLDGHPLVGINPEAGRYDGILLPFAPRDLATILPDILADKRKHKTVSMAEVRLMDGQRLRAVNDLFVGPRSHGSARYEIALGDRREVQSSSGLIVATGLGSTAWMKSVITGAFGVAAAFATGSVDLPEIVARPWDDQELAFAVREPFPSQTSQASLICGRIAPPGTLRLRSLMPENGVIFSDGIEADHLTFAAGMEATIGLSSRRGRLIV